MFRKVKDMLDKKLLKNTAAVFVVLLLLAVVLYGVPSLLTVAKLAGVSVLATWLLPKAYNFVKSKL